MTLKVVLAFGAAAFVVAGLAGQLSAAWGYAFFLLAGGALAAALAACGVLGLTRRGDAAALLRAARQLSILALGAYVLAVAALAGHYAHETWAGRMAWHWVLFGPLVLAALVAFEWGIYRKLFAANLVALERWRPHLSRKLAEPQAMRRMLVDDVLVHRSLWRTSRLRWLRHTLIFWGFAAMFGAELAAVFVREAMPAFGWGDPWRAGGGPLRLAFDLVFDLTGAMMFAGCLLALAWRWRVRGTAEQRFADTPMVLALLLVVTSGFAVEGARLALEPAAAHHAFSFVGLAFAQAFGAFGAQAGGWVQVLWLAHAIAACALIGWIPATRLVHTCATPFGRLLQSQKGLLAAKKHAVLSGLLRPHS